MLLLGLVGASDSAEVYSGKQDLLTRPSRGCPCHVQKLVLHVAFTAAAVVRVMKIALFGKSSPIDVNRRVGSC